VNGGERGQFGLVTTFRGQGIVIRQQRKKVEI